MRIRTGIYLVSLYVLAGCGPGSIEFDTDPWQPPTGPATTSELIGREACENRVAERQALFGDLHLHTSVSMDANSLGTRTMPDDAYRFATGETIDVFTGDPALGTRQVKIDRPLDFAAVTDHAEFMGEVALCTTPGSASYDSPGCAVYRGEETHWIATLSGTPGFRARIFGMLGFTGRRDDVCGADDKICRESLGEVWRANWESAERFYDRSSDCNFTTFHAWEYSHSPRSTKVHRNVILRNEITPELPISSLETPVEMDLRRQLVELCNDTDTGCEAIAIPHNPNLSNGQMFKIEYADLPLERQREEAALRARLEPVVEMMQIKGESECRNGMYQVLGAPDELCGFEKIRDMGWPEMPDCEEGADWGAQAGKGCTSRTDYVRYALLEGLREKERLGVNPFAFGYIGSTDTHMSVPGAVNEADVPYKFGATTEALLTVPDRRRATAFQNPGGLAGVWAEENNRDSIFDAMKRRETFATSGPRILPRFYAGRSMPDDICESPDMAQMGYDHGVPMGGVLNASEVGSDGPVFAVSAQADSGTPEYPGGLLQRIQVIKGWVGEDGQFHQAVYDVAGDADNGAGVEMESCTPVGPGATSLCSVWRDPEFDAGKDAVYYARVVENPSCRWSARLCLSLPEEERPNGCEILPQTIQERAWTSPIWYGAE